MYIGRYGVLVWFSRLGHVNSDNEGDFGKDEGKNIELISSFLHVLEPHNGIYYKF